MKPSPHTKKPRDPLPGGGASSEMRSKRYFDAGFAAAGEAFFSDFSTDFLTAFLWALPFTAGLLSVTGALSAGGLAGVVCAANIGSEAAANAIVMNVFFMAFSPLRALPPAHNPILRQGAGKLDSLRRRQNTSISQGFRLRSDERAILKSRMLARQITPQNIFRVLAGGFALVILLLLAAAFVGVRSVQSLQENAADLVREQSVTNRLIDELHSQQTSLSEVFSVLARDPDSVDYDRIMAQLDEADRDIDRISAEGAQTAESRLWARLRSSSADFSREARRLLTTENIETYASVELFRDHAAFTSVVARLLEVEYRKVSAAQAQIDRRSSRLLSESAVFTTASVLLALIFATVTLRMASQLIHAMEEQTGELSRVSWQMLDNQEATARRFSHELHDELGQSLTAVKANLAAIEAGGAFSHERVEDCLRLVDDAIGNVRQMSQLLRPTILDDFGLEAGLRWLADGFATRTGIEVTVDSRYAGRLPDETETHLFRIAQEALTNVARHSGATHVQFTLEPEPNGVRLTVRDNGRGLPAKQDGPRGLGLIGIRARARSAGGAADIRSTPGQGVLIEVRVPIPHEAHPNPVG
jgi:signal transduction histidine kinase